MGGRMARRQANLRKTLTIQNKYHAPLERWKQIENKESTGSWTLGV